MQKLKKKWFLKYKTKQTKKKKKLHAKSLKKKRSLKNRTKETKKTHTKKSEIKIKNLK